MQIILQVPVDTLFPDEHSTFDRLRSLLGNLNKTDTLFWIARLNLILSNPNHDDALDKQRYIVEHFLMHDEVARLNRFITENARMNISLLLRPALLELSRWVIIHCPDEPDSLETFNSSEVRTCFIKCALISAKIWADRMYQNGIEAENYQYLPLLRKNAEQNQLSAPMWKMIARGKHLFTKCISRFYPNIHKEFHDATGLTIDEYYSCAIMILSQYCDVTPEKVRIDNNKCGGFRLDSMLDQSTRKAKHIMEQYMLFDSQAPGMANASLLEMNPDAQNPSVEIDLMHFIHHPIIRSEGKHKMGIVMDLVSYSKKVSMAPFFALMKLHKNNTDRMEKIKRCLGSAFEESYVHDLLVSMFSCTNDCRLVSSPKLYLNQGEQTASMEVQLCDFAIIRGSDLLLIEVKASLISDAKVRLDSPDVYKTEVLNKFGRTSKKRALGVGQLVEAICKLSGGNWKSEEIDTKSIKHIYSILLCYDELVPIFGQIDLFAKKFLSALNPDSLFPGTAHMQKGRFVCTPLVVMSIDELENLQNSGRYFSLFDLLSDYTRNPNDRPDSISAFIKDQSTDSRYKFFYNQPMIDRTIDALHTAGELFFGTTRA
jgi:hypothetical protein